jgi:hypothetical protein
MCITAATSGAFDPLFSRLVSLPRRLALVTQLIE